MSGGSLSKPCNSPDSEQMGRGLCRRRAVGGSGAGGDPHALRRVECAPSPSLTVSAARRATTWRRNRGRAGMCGMRCAATRCSGAKTQVPAARALGSRLYLIRPHPQPLPDRPGHVGVGRVLRKQAPWRGLGTERGASGSSDSSSPGLPRGSKPAAAATNPDGTRRGDLKAGV